jgi:hypothetical protein
MELIKNYADWITPEFMQHITTYEGDTVPVWQPKRWKGHPMLDEATERARPGYSHRKHDFQQFNPQSKDMQNFRFDLPVIPGDEREILWWIVKLYPGQMQTMHFDPHLLDVVNPNRYTMFLQDWKPGHIFVYDDKIKTDYKAGDLYKWYDPMMYHGVVNIGYETRYTLQITTIDRKQ